MLKIFLVLTIMILTVMLRSSMVRSMPISAPTPISPPAKDSCQLDAPGDLQLVLLGFRDIPDSGAAEIVTAVVHGCVSWVFQLLMEPQDPNMIHGRTMFVYIIGIGECI